MIFRDTKDRLEQLESNYKHLTQQYYDLWGRYERLLEFLGVMQYERPPGIVTKKKEDA